MAKKKKQRASFRKNRLPRPRSGDLTSQFAANDLDEDKISASERISGKGELTRHRTIRTVDCGERADDSQVVLDVDTSTCRAGRVLRVHGLSSVIQAEDGSIFECATRRLLKTLSTEDRHVVAAGDQVAFRPSGAGEGIIERIEPRHGVLSRSIRGRRHVLVANVDQALVISSAAEPDIKPHFIDRFLLTAEKAELRPIICVNKIDLVEPSRLMPLVGVYARMGYEVILTSVRESFGIERLRQMLAGRQSVVTGQSGVGKSSLLNAVEPGLGLRVAEVSAETQKGRHTTTTAELLPLSFGGYVVDTPGIRQFQLWDVVAAEVAGFFRDLRPFVSACRFPNCTHTHEQFCAVKDAVADGWLDMRRYESYQHLLRDEP